MIIRILILLALNGVRANLPPVFIKDMNNLALPENTKVGDVVYILQGYDPEGFRVKYGLIGTDKFGVDPLSGEVTLKDKLDREINDTLTFIVELEDVVPDSNNNIVRVPVSVIVLDENDNAPEFTNSPYEADVYENATIGTTIIENILIEDKDSFGETLEVSCVSLQQWSEACGVFEIVTQESSQSKFKGSLVLKAPLNYNIKHSYQFQLYATDGQLNSTAGVEVRVIDVQNLPPTFTGSLAAVLFEDTAIGTVALKINAKDGDRAHPRNITYDLLTNPHDYFLLDALTGELKTGKPLDRESLSDTSAPLNLTVRAREIVDDRPVNGNLTTSIATVTITIRDVNDEPPRFNRKEYTVEIPENIPAGTPLPNLDMIVTDTDIGPNSAFSLRLSDVSGAFVVEPSEATGSTQVSIRLTNFSLDYENPNQRKFIILVIAEELNTTPRLSTTATVTVTVTDVNDNMPIFKQASYSATVSEQESPGTHIMTITAIDRDHARYGTEGIVYELSGNGAELFSVDNRTGVITVAFCPTPGSAPCLDYETSPDYFLSYKATDDDGAGQSTVVPLKISLLDTNDNPPEFLRSSYSSSIDEGAVKFDPDLQVQAKDVDKTSVLTYSIIEGLNSQFFDIDPITGKIYIQGNNGLDMNKVKDDHIALTIQASDGEFNATCQVEITIRDVNNNAPVFDMNIYNASVSEDAPIGFDVIRVHATDMDTGENSDIKYSIQKGAFDDFAIKKDTGQITIASKLDYDRRNVYQMQIIAIDQGTPSLTGTTVLTVRIVNANDKSPYFSPLTQRTEVSVSAEVGTIIHKLVAIDPDILSLDDLQFSMGIQLITAVDKNSKQVSENGIIRNWFVVEPNGDVKVAHPLDRNMAAVVSLPVTVHDTSAPGMQTSEGLLIITIVDVNSSPPTFRQTHFLERFIEELPANTNLTTFHATDVDSSISHYAIDPPNQYFQIDNITGIVKSTQRIDYERIHQINFTVVAYDTGVPQLSTSVDVTVNIVNINDEEPIFDEPMYEASVEENAPAGMSILTVHATDKDEGVFGQVRYNLTGDQADLFTMDAITGEIKVATVAIIDREVIDDIWLLATAVDNAPIAAKKTGTASIHIKILDQNDNAPIFSQRTYKQSVTENLVLNPPAPILQVQAKDKDIMLNGQIKYSIVEQTEEGAFTLDPVRGILYPALPLKGNTTHHIKVTAVDCGGDGPHSDTAFIDINVDSVNQHAPVWITPTDNQPFIYISENEAQADIILITIKAEDQDTGENGRISYFLNVNNKNVHETNEFSLDETTGELRTKVFLDREQNDRYELKVVAQDHGYPMPLETIKWLTIALNDSNDNKPHFMKSYYEFSIAENQPPSTIIGSIKAMDKDTGENGRVYYHVFDGNEKGMFVIDKTQGIIRSNKSIDREEESEYMLTIFASNEPLISVTDKEKFNEYLNSKNLTIGKSYEMETDSSITIVKIKILDENDNPPAFEKSMYYAGVKSTAKINDLIIPIKARDPDLDANGDVNYLISASNLYKFGNQSSSGSIVPSPFNITHEGLLLTANYMAEYNQDRFILNIIAQESQAPYRRASTEVYIWVIKPEQLVRMIFSQSCTQVNKQQNDIIARLSNATSTILVVNAIKHYSQSEYNDGCDLHFHVVEPSTMSVIPVEHAVEMIDLQYDQLKDLYEKIGIVQYDTVLAASKTTTANQESFDPALAALIALLIVLFTGIVTFVVVCSCLKQWVLPMPKDNLMHEKGSVKERSKRLLQELSSTDNPLWAEHKLRLYEEQELTMNVFGENNDGYPNTQDLPQVDNTYATIQGSGERDYATLNSPRNGSQMMSDSHGMPVNFEAMLGFQGSTFQPELPETPEPPPRSGNFQNSG